MANSNPVRRLEMSVEKQRERGKMGKGIKKGFVLRKSRNCNPKCPMFTMCRFQPLSKEVKGKCALANSTQLTDKRKHRVVKFLFGTQQEQIELMREVALNIDMKVDKDNIKELKELLTAIGYIYDKEFGSKIEHSGQVEGVVINIIKPEEKKEDKE